MGAMIDPTEDMPGKLLTHPGLRGRLRVRPILDRKTTRTKALRVQVFTDAGLEILNIRAAEVELTKVVIPGDPPETRPGAIWFYSDTGIGDVGFLPDSNAATLDLPGATEQPRRGRQGARKARERQT